MHIRGPTIQTYEGPQGPGTMLLKSGTAPEIRGPLRPMQSTMIIIIMAKPQACMAACCIYNIYAHRLFRDSPGIVTGHSLSYHMNASAVQRIFKLHSNIGIRNIKVM